ncbi:MAG TPA: hypothetical protein EYH06_03110 [Chromatiales bacterium]|nr:hypothetical protein [Thiotrichales bacterium]HIP67559.1 hypothetical protein [Chromatiales bacterium]
MTTFTLEKLIGRSGEVDGKWLEVIEIIHDGSQVVLKETGTKRSILNNQYGEASSLTFQTYTIPIRSTLRNELHPVIKSLLDDEEIETLSAILKKQEK